MKRLKRIVCLLLALSLALFVFAGCETKEQRIYNKVYQHLSDKYQGIDFQINGYVQDTQTSGKYTFDVTCLTTGVDFEVIMTSLFLSDSYFVSHANKKISDEVFAVLGTAAELVYLDEIICFDPYMDQGGNYRFNENVELMSYTLESIHEMYRVMLSDVVSTDEAAQSVWMFCERLASHGITLDKVNFQFVLNGETVRLETNTKTMASLRFEELKARLDEAKSPAALGELFYREPDSDIKVIPFFSN